MTFKIGQKVVCKDDGNPTNRNVSPKGIRLGGVYEISGFDDCEYCGLKMLLLKGIDSGSRKECVNCAIPILPTNAFSAYRFEPVKHDHDEVKKGVKMKTPTK